MNAPANTQIATLDAAIARANDWVCVARPIIFAMNAVEEATFPITSARLSDPKGYACGVQMSPDARTWEEAGRYLTKCREQLSEMLAGIRDNALCDERMPGPQESEPEEPIERQAWDNAWSDAEDFNDDLDRCVTTVEAAIKLIEEEHNAAFFAVDRVTINSSNSNLSGRQ